MIMADDVAAGQQRSDAHQRGDKKPSNVTKGRAYVTERRSKVLRLRASGLSYEAIAQQVGLPSANAAIKDASRALDDRQALLDREAARFIVLEMERLETLQRSMETLLRTAAMQQNQALVLAAVDRLLRISQRRARMLGLDADYGPRKPKPKTQLDELRERRLRRRGGR